MATHDYIISNASGAAVRADLNNALAAIATNNSSATAPTTTYAYQWWADTGSSPTVMKLRNAANSAWITLFQLDGEWSLIPFENGTAAAPSIYFKDSGTDTGIFSPGTDQVGISAGGTSRFEVSTTATTSTLPVVHPLGAVGTPSITFTGDLNTGIYSPAADTIAFVKGGVEAMRIDSSSRVGIGSNAPGALLDVLGSSDTVLLSSNATNSTTKEAKIQCRHYTNAEENLMLLYGFSTSTDNNIWLGGGASAQNAATNIVFATATNNTTTSGTERARIDSSGRLLVGTSTARSNVRFNADNKTPSVQFETAGNEYYGLSVIHNSNAGYSGNIWIGATNGTAIGSNGLVGGQALGNLHFVGGDGTNLIHGARIHAETDGTTGANDLPTRLVFSTTKDGASSPVQRLRLTNNGVLFVITDNSTCQVNSTTVSAGTGDAFFIGRHSGTAGTADSGTASVLIYTNGNIQNTNGSYTAISDAKLKENIVDAASQWDDFKAIRIRNWNFKAETGHETHRQIGPIAQELEQVCPGLVFEAPDRDEEGNETGETTKGVNQSVLYMKAVKALQEAMERIEALEAKVAALEAS